MVGVGVRGTGLVEDSGTGGAVEGVGVGVDENEALTVIGVDVGGVTIPVCNSVVVFGAEGARNVPLPETGDDTFPFLTDTGGLVDESVDVRVCVGVEPSLVVVTGISIGFVPPPLAAAILSLFSLSLSLSSTFFLTSL